VGNRKQRGCWIRRRISGFRHLNVRVLVILCWTKVLEQIMIPAFYKMFQCMWWGWQEEYFNNNAFGLDSVHNVSTTNYINVAVMRNSGAENIVSCAFEICGVRFSKRAGHLQTLRQHTGLCSCI
jgi:hypothetical protein